MLDVKMYPILSCNAIMSTQMKREMKLDSATETFAANFAA